MKGMKLLAWFLFILCTHALSSLALPSFFKLEHEGALNLSRPIVQGQEIHVRSLHAGVDGTVELNGENHQVADSRKNRRGKSAVYSGGNIAHRPPTDKSSAPSLVVRPQQPFLITKTMLQVTSALILILPFQVL